MSVPSTSPHLYDILEAIERVRQALGDMHLDAFEADWQKQWLVQRGVEIISEASRRLPDELKARHPEIPWPKVAGSATYYATITKTYPPLFCGNS